MVLVTRGAPETFRFSRVPHICIKFFDVKKKKKIIKIIYLSNIESNAETQSSSKRILIIAPLTNTNYDSIWNVYTLYFHLALTHCKTHSRKPTKQKHIFLDHSRIRKDKKGSHFCGDHWRSRNPD